MKYLMGILENVLVKVKKIFIFIDFIMLDMEEDEEIPIILGCPFLVIDGVVIDVKNGRLTLKASDEKVELNLSLLYILLTLTIFFKLILWMS